MEFERKKYLNELIDMEGKGFIKIVTGLRRCGKTYLVFTLFKRHLLESGVAPDHIFEMNFDDRENARYRDPDVFYPFVKEFIRDDGRYYILLDEVQLLGDFEGVLNGLLRRPNVDIYVTGSNSKFLSKDVITEFRGRGWEIRLRPLSFSEFMDGYDGDRRDGWEEYRLYGGLPPVALLDTPEEKRRELGALFDATYLLDIVQRYGLKRRSEMNDILDMLSSSIGSLTNPYKLSRTFKTERNVSISPNTVENYLDWLCDAFVVERARRYDVKGKKYINSPYKFYFTDIGLRNARVGFRQLEESHAMENVIYNELVSRGYSVDVGVVTLYENGEEGTARNRLEIDFVCNEGSMRYYVQSALNISEYGKRAQEMRPLLNTNDNFKKIAVVKDTGSPWYTEEGVLVMNIYDFLLDPDSLYR